MGIRQVTLGLVGQGKKRIAYVVPQDIEDVSLNVRNQGYMSALQSSGLETHSIVFEGTHFQGMHACSHFYQTPLLLQQFDAFVCNTDEIALGVLEVLKHHKVAVPSEVAVTGFDDLPIVSQHSTTIRQDLDHIAAKTIELLQLAIKGDTPFSVISPVEIVHCATG